MEPLKNIYNPKSIKKIAQQISLKYNDFNEEEFLKYSLKNLNKKEMKERVKHLASAYKCFLPTNFKKATKILLATLGDEIDHENNEWDGQSSEGLSGFLIWPHTQFIEDYGQSDFETSIKALYEMTKRFTAEFAIRPFIEKNPKEIYKILNTWSTDPNHHVRRLVSEGTRPNLPWGIKVNYIQKNLKRNISLIEKLKYDDSEYVRRSVANHLNDISRIDEELMIATCQKWAKDKKVNKKIIRHASRTLLKKGQPEILALHGYHPLVKIDLTKKQTSPKSIKLGDSLNIDLRIKSRSNISEKLLIEAKVYFLKNNGEHSPKVFRLKDVTIKEKETLNINKDIKFKPVTTRKHYAGTQYIEILINGKSFGKEGFKLTL